MLGCLLFFIKKKKKTLLRSYVPAGLVFSTRLLGYVSMTAIRTANVGFYNFTIGVLPPLPH
jgi:hypothetical protein